MQVQTKLKVCGVTSVRDLQACARLGVDSVGLNLWPGSRRGLTLAQARELKAAWPAKLECVGVFVDAEPSEVLAWHRELRFDYIQPHGDRPVAHYLGLGIACVWVIRGTPELVTLEVPSPKPARILLDAAVLGFGGAGKQTDWGWARTAVAALSKIAPVWLAGGITPENAAIAISTVGPAGLDVASGAEPNGATGGQKSSERVAALVAACHPPTK